MNVGGSLPLSCLAPDRSLQCSVTMTFGSTGFFGLTPVSATEAGWWATYTDTSNERLRKTTSTPNDPGLARMMKERYGGFKNAVVQKVLDDLSTDGGTDGHGRLEKATLDLHTPTWVLSKLPRWSKGRVVLVGGAAHALPSTSGQGPSQAFEDTAALSLLLKAACSRDSDDGGQSLSDEAVETTLDRFEQLRKPRVEAILDDALRMQGHKRDLRWWEEMLMYAVLWIVIRVSGGKQEAWKFDCDVKEAVERSLQV